MLLKEARRFFDLLGLRGDLIQVRRVAHPEKRAHTLYEATYPGLEPATASEEHVALKRLCDLAEARGPTPDHCQATKKNGQPCRNAPQRGHRYCGAHLPEAAKVSASEAAPGLCQGTTKKGRPCQNAPQRGEVYCGPHLEKHRKQSGVD